MSDPFALLLVIGFNGFESMSTPTILGIRLVSHLRFDLVFDMVALVFTGLIWFLHRSDISLWDRYCLRGDSIDLGIWLRILQGLIFPSMESIKSKRGKWVDSFSGREITGVENHSRIALTIGDRVFARMENQYVIDFPILDDSVPIRDLRFMNGIRFPISTFSECLVKTIKSALLVLFWSHCSSLIGNLARILCELSELGGGIFGSSGVSSLFTT